MASLRVPWSSCRTGSVLHEQKSKIPKKQRQKYMTQTRLIAKASNCGRAAIIMSSPSPNSITSKPILRTGETCCDRREMTDTGKRERVVEEAICPENLDEWMNDSVEEIIRNIGEAPFLVHVYHDGAMGSSPITQTRFEREKAVAESWRLVRRRWFEGSPIPQGVILVEEIENKEDDADQQKSIGNGSNSHMPSPTTRAWGILVQGRGVDSVASYILKTCRVLTSLGFCTHFCLVRAKCFADTAELQLKNSWLQR